MTDDGDVPTYAPPPAGDSLTLPVRTRDDFRRALAGLADPDRALTAGDAAAFRPVADRLVVLLCSHFGGELDRKTLWSRIDSGLQAACARCSDGDADAWLDLLLGHVKADPGAVACDPAAAGVRADLAAPDATHRRAFVRWVETRRFAVIAHGRAAWEAAKAVRASAAAEGGAG